MIGKDLYKTEINAELSGERLKSLVFFYGPLIGNDALILYEYLVLQGTQYSFNEINDLLYHVMVLAVNQGLDWADVEKVLDERNEKIGNLKQFKTVDKNT